MNNSGTDMELVREIELTDIETFYRRFSLRQGLSASTGLKKRESRFILTKWRNWEGSRLIKASINLLPYFGSSCDLEEVTVDRENDELNKTSLYIPSPER